jgi:hypothetical protein
MLDVKVGSVGLFGSNTRKLVKLDKPDWPSIAENLRSAEMIGYSSTQSDMEVNFPCS